MSYSLVWFKRDLRWHDHAALARAARLGAVRCIYVLEPELWRQSDAALQHFEFMRESLQVLDAELRRQRSAYRRGIADRELPADSGVARPPASQNGSPTSRTFAMFASSKGPKPVSVSCMRRGGAL